MQKTGAQLCIFFVALGLVLGGCSSQVPSTGAPPTDPSITSPSTTPAPSGRTISYNLGDKQGYTVAVDVSFAPVKFSSSIVDAAPGSTDLDGTFGVQGTITNTTDGRATDPLNGESLYALYDISSPVCTKLLPHSTTVCLLLLGSILSPQGANTIPTPLAPSGSEDIVWSPSPLTFGAPEADAGKWVSAFNTPMGYAVRPITEWSIPGSCDVFVDGPGMGAGFDFTLADYPSAFTCA